MSHLKNTLGLAVVFSCASMSLAAEKVTAEKKLSPVEAEVRAVVHQHIDGIVNADIKQLERAWNTDAGRISFVSRNADGEEIVQTGPITDSFKLWTERKVKGTNGKIQSVDIVNDKMAVVKAQVTWKGQIFDDYLVLLNTEGDWKLVSKTYSSKRVGSPYGVSLRYGP